MYALVLVSVMGAQAQSQYFVVTASSQQFAQQCCASAEKARKDMAILWLGHEIRAWKYKCPIRVTVTRGGNGGATEFVFGGEAIRMSMSVRGSAQRILDSVIPHEVVHTIMATHFGGPLPRWCDEGMCTSIEHDSERIKLRRLLVRALRTGNYFKLSRMMTMGKYPSSNIRVFYAQGYSLTWFLCVKQGTRVFVKFVEDGMRGGWTASTKKHFGYNSVKELQDDWVRWVMAGSPGRPKKPPKPKVKEFIIN